MSLSQQEISVFDEVAQEAVELANRIAAENPESDLWDIASGLLAGAVQYWLYSRQPCGDPFCDSCAEVSTAEQRIRQLIDEAKEFAEESDYYHSPNDANVGTA
jgi:hypothetical protein